MAKAKRAIEEESDQRLEPPRALSTSSSWSYLNRLGNLVFGRSFAIPSEKIHLSPIQARERYVLLYNIRNTEMTGFVVFFYMSEMIQ